MAKKAALKRIKITKRGKLLHRQAGLNHFNAKASRRSQLRRKNLTVLSGTTEKKIRQYL
mgnify:CR=1 FL=1